MSNGFGANMDTGSPDRSERVDDRLKMKRRQRYGARLKRIGAASINTDDANRAAKIIQDILGISNIVPA